MERDRGREQRHHGSRGPKSADRHPPDAGIDLTSPAGADGHRADAHGGSADFRVPSCPRAAAGPPPLVLPLDSWRPGDRPTAAIGFVPASPRSSPSSHPFPRVAEPRLSGFLLSSRRPQSAAGSVFLIPEDSSHPRGQPPPIKCLFSAQTIDNQDTQSGLAPDVVGCSLKP